MKRFDFVFSNWMFVWFILHQLLLVSYSPVLLFYLGLLGNFVILFIMLYYSYPYVGLFILIVFLFKGVPLWLMRNEPFCMEDLYVSIGVFMVYLLWMAVNRQNVFTLFSSHIKSIQANKPWGPITEFFVNKMK